MLDFLFSDETVDEDLSILFPDPDIAKDEIDDFFEDRTELIFQAL